MYRLLFALPLAAAAAFALPSVADAGPEPGTGTLVVRATTGVEEFGVTGLVVAVTGCGTGPALATLTTGGRPGTASRDLPAGCYRAEVGAVPGGCQLGSDSRVQVDVRPGATVLAPFRMRCA